MSAVDLLSPDDLDHVRSLLHRHAGIHLGEEKRYLVETRLDELARLHGFADPTALVDRLRRTPVGPLHWELIEAHTINETSFFRAPHVFDHLAEEVLPALIAARAPRRRLRIWSAACSTGQEPFSLAMLLRERFPELAGWDVDIVASDLCRRALRRLDGGTYSDLEVRRGLSDDLRSRYLSRTGNDWRLAFTVRHLVRPRRLNLVEPFPDDLPVFDLVLLRNVLIYFDRDTRRDVLRRLGQVAAPDAVLVLGETETSLEVDVPYERVTSERAVHYRLGARTAPTVAATQPSGTAADGERDQPETP